MPVRGVSRGVVVNIASVSSFRRFPHAVSYTTSKHAVVGLTRVAALDNIKYNIRVNCVCPSWVDTPMVTRISKATQGIDKRCYLSYLWVEWQYQKKLPTR